SAVYATDRSVLKQIMSAPKRERTVVIAEPVAEPRQELPKVAGAENVAVAEKKKSVEKPAVEAAPIPTAQKLDQVTLSDEALRDDIYKELEKLQRLKKDFALSVEAFEKGIPMPAPKRKRGSPASSAEPIIDQIKSGHKEVKADSPKQKEQNEIIEEFI